MANAVQALAGNSSVTPSRAVVSRTITPSPEATSTHWPPLAPLLAGYIMRAGTELIAREIDPLQLTANESDQ